jgi:hypothetical protein
MQRVFSIGWDFMLKRALSSLVRVYTLSSWEAVSSRQIEILVVTRRVICLDSVIAFLRILTREDLIVELEFLEDTRREADFLLGNSTRAIDARTLGPRKHERHLFLHSSNTLRKGCPRILRFKSCYLLHS